MSSKKPTAADAGIAQSPFMALLVLKRRLHMVRFTAVDRVSLWISDGRLPSEHLLCKLP